MDKPAELEALRQRVAELEAKAMQYKRCIRLLGNAWLTTLEHIQATDPEEFDLFYAPIIRRLLSVAREKARGEQ